MKMILYSLLSLFFISACGIIEKERGFHFVFNDTIITLPQHPRLLFSKEITAQSKTGNNVVVAVLMGENLKRLKEFPVENIRGLNEWE